ncbi:MAG: dienelactone hydrolase [Phycisphaerae bacterium]|nr:dienelactone hydrolase [Phycisphaerae bacterium]
MNSMMLFIVAAMFVACSSNALAAPETAPDWIRALQVPHEPPPDTKPPVVYDLMKAPDGSKITTPAQWQTQRRRILDKWTKFLGRLPEPRCPLSPKTTETVPLDGNITRKLIELQVEPDVWMRCYLFIPPGKGPFPACVCLHSTNDETIRQPAGLGSQPEKAFALDLVKRGYVTIASENFEWRYPGRPTTGKAWDRYHAVARIFLDKYPGVKGMTKMIHDASRCVDYLCTLPQVRKDRIGAIGHSLGAKEVTYLQAFDDRVVCGVSSEGGVAFEFTNYHDPWYLGPDIRKKETNLFAHEVVALIPPRAWLLIGGNNTDGDKSWPYVRPVIPIYRLLGKPANVGLFVHTKGHAVPPEARDIAFRWLDYHLKK